MKLPPHLARLESKPGTHRRGLKTLWYGDDKSGKSFALASFPGPRLALDCGEGGIQPYLTKGDTCLTIMNPDDAMAAVDFLEESGDHFKSVLVDPINELWDSWMEFWCRKLNKDSIQGGDWRKVKPPWKVLLFKLMHGTHHTAFAAWLNPTKFYQPSGAPGETEGLRVEKQDVPKVEVNVPYTVDLVFRCGVKLDEEWRRTNEHTVRYCGGRVPRSVRPQLHIGREWSFNELDPLANPFKEILEPVLEKWSMGAVDHMGVGDPEYFEAVRKTIMEVGGSYALGKIMILMDACPAKTAQEYRTWWREHIHPLVTNVTLNPKAREVYEAAHESLKKKFGVDDAA
jgi:hypothetical protein